MKIYSWNVNGLRAVAKKGFEDWLGHAKPDIIAIQEIKALPEQLPKTLLKPAGYEAIFTPATRKGYSGTATFYKPGFAPTNVDNIGVEEFDDEGRVQVLEYDGFYIVNAYYPNSRPERARLDFKLRFCKQMKILTDGLVKSGKGVVLGGDYNIAHKPIDLARPKQNENNPGYYIEEREAMDTFIDGGYVDTFRMFNTDPGHYSWWSYRAKARERNVGWRIDYWCVNRGFKKRVVSAGIEPSVLGSDHCPVTVEIE